MRSTTQVFNSPPAYIMALLLLYKLIDSDFYTSNIYYSLLYPHKPAILSSDGPLSSCDISINSSEIAPKFTHRQLQTHHGRPWTSNYYVYVLWWRFSSDLCTKCRIIQSAGSDAEREAVIVSHKGSLSSRSDRLMRLRGYLSAMGAGVLFRIWKKASVGTVSKNWSLVSWSVVTIWQCSHPRS